jgi:hypothetical protein
VAGLVTGAAGRGGWFARRTTAGCGALGVDGDVDGGVDAWRLVDGRMLSGGVSSAPERTGVEKAAREAVAIMRMNMRAIPQDKVNFCAFATH